MALHAPFGFIVLLLLLVHQTRLLLLVLLVENLVVQLSQAFLLLRVDAYDGLFAAHLLLVMVLHHLLLVLLVQHFVDVAVLRNT